MPSSAVYKPIILSGMMQMDLQVLLILVSAILTLVAKMISMTMMISAVKCNKRCQMLSNCKRTG